MENLFYEQAAYSTYMDDLNKSQGFYVTQSNGPVHRGAIRPVKEQSSDLYRRAELAAKFAVDEHNKKEAVIVGMSLKFQSIVNLNVEPCAGKMYFITMEAQYLCTGETNHYHVKVWEKLSGAYKVMIFRKAPYCLSLSVKFVKEVYCIGIENLKPWMDECYLYYKCFYRGGPQVLGVEVYNEGEEDYKAVLWFKSKPEAGMFLIRYMGERMPCTDDQYYEFSVILAY